MRGSEVRLEAGASIELTSQRTGRVVRAYVGEEVGRGGTALVYSGQLEEDGSQVVLKVQRFEGEPDPALELEAHLFRDKLRHRNIVHCVGVGEGRDGLILGFRRVYPNPLLLLGESSVAAEMRRDKKAFYASLPLDAAIDLGYELLNALAYLETLQLVHHDVKLANLLIDVGPNKRVIREQEIFGLVVRRAYRGVLIDFGATRSQSYLADYNRGAAPPGMATQITPLYAPPESVVESRRDDGELGRTLDPSLDVYAAALVIYAMITGHPPYSHLQNPPDASDLESVISVKSAERRGQIETISSRIIERTVFEDTKFVGGDRAAFDMGLHRLLAPRLDPDPAARGTAAEMKREFEKLMRISSARGDESAMRKKGRVYLPFEQGLVRVGAGEHPLFKAARLYGLADREHEPEPVAQAPSKGKFSAEVDELVDMVFVDEAAQAIPRAQQPTEKFQKSKVPPPPKDVRPTQPFRRSSGRHRLEGLGLPEAQEAGAESFWGDEPRKKPEPRPEETEVAGAGDYAFRGSPGRLLRLHLLAIVLLLGSLASLVLGLGATGIRPVPAGIDPVVERLVRSIQALVTDVSQVGLVQPHWPRAVELLEQVPPLAAWGALVVCVVFLLQAMLSIKLFRIRHTAVFGELLVYEATPGLGASVGDLLLVVVTLGLGLPWVLVRRTRRFYRDCTVPAVEQRLDFTGTGFQALWRGLLTLLALPLAIVTLGVVGLCLQFMWRKWEQQHVLVPDPSGEMMRSMRFEGRMGDYVRMAFKGWVRIVLTLGLYRPWAVAKVWRWIDAHTVVER